MNIDEYRNILSEDILAASKVNRTKENEEFLTYAAGILINGEEIEDFSECYYEGVTRRNGNMRIDGYSWDENDGSCCIFVSEFFCGSEDDAVRNEDISIIFRKIRLFVEESINCELYTTLRGFGAVQDFARDLYYDHERITKYRFYFITNAYNRQRVKTLKDEKIGNTIVELNVWDITRLYDLVRSKAQKESVEIAFADFGVVGIPCVKAVDYHNIIADIDVIPGNEDENGKKSNVISYESFLAVVPGTILNDLYLEYGSKLLEGNVRSFLSVRGKVNKSIQSTIKNYPEMFFAYNNGIAATATEVRTEMTSEGLKITYIKDLQIVNGGQTTASIANTLLTAKKDEKINISNLFVPMKLSVLDHTSSERIIPKISEYSNSQNKVDASDFFSNHPFHIRMEEYSRKTPIPSVNGNQYSQYWFYERTRGQYNQGKMKLRGGELKRYSDTYPEKQVITMIDLARYMELYMCAPEIVSRGKQKLLQSFAEQIKKDWDKSDLTYNSWYFKRVVSLAIIYKCTDEIIKNTEWYKEKKSYKANVISYTLSLIFFNIKKKHKGYELDFNRIWNEQDIYEELEEQIEVLSSEVYRFITGPRGTENVTEWCKKDVCWSNAKEYSWTFMDSFVRTLVETDSLQKVVKEEKKTRLIENEVNLITEIINRGSDYWQKVLDWGKTHKLLTETEITYLSMIIKIEYTGRIPNDKQAQIVNNARARLIKNGMPYSF